jgi:hypothetical protein
METETRKTQERRENRFSRNYSRRSNRPNGDIWGWEVPQDDDKLYSCLMHALIAWHNSGRPCLEKYGVQTQSHPHEKEEVRGLASAVDRQRFEALALCRGLCLALSLELSDWLGWCCVRRRRRGTMRSSSGEGNRRTEERTNRNSGKHAAPFFISPASQRRLVVADLWIFGFFDFGDDDDRSIETYEV